MDLRELVRSVDAETARAFVTAARHVVDALMIEAERVEALGTPAKRDYETAELGREAPAGGWISHVELRETTRRLSEAIAAERWADGVLFVVKLLSMAGGGR